MAELAIKKMLVPDFSDWNCRSNFYPERSRKDHLEKTGRKHGEAIPIQEEVRRLSEYVRKRMREDFFKRHPVSGMRQAGRFAGKILRRRK